MTLILHLSSQDVMAHEHECVLLAYSSIFKEAACVPETASIWRAVKTVSFTYNSGLI